MTRPLTIPHAGHRHGRTSKSEVKTEMTMLPLKNRLINRGVMTRENAGYYERTIAEIESKVINEAVRERDDQLGAILRGQTQTIAGLREELATLRAKADRLRGAARFILPCDRAWTYAQIKVWDAIAAYDDLAEDAPDDDSNPVEFDGINAEPINEFAVQKRLDDHERRIERICIQDIAWLRGNMQAVQDAVRDLRERLDTPPELVAIGNLAVVKRHLDEKIDLAKKHAIERDELVRREIGRLESRLYELELAARGEVAK